MDWYANNKALKDFVHSNNLMDEYSRIHFKANVDIKTDKNEVTLPQTFVTITFDGYNNHGTLTLHESGIDANEFPAEFKAQFQNMEYRDNLYLYISGKHPFPIIGNYSVVIMLP